MVKKTDIRLDENDLNEDYADELDADLDLESYEIEESMDTEDLDTDLEDTNYDEVEQDETAEEHDETLDDYDEIEDDYIENNDVNNHDEENPTPDLTHELAIDSFEDFVAKKDLVPPTEDHHYKALEEISFKVSCEIGSVAVSLNELLNLKIGDCLEFMRWPGKVKLKLNDYLFAEGYLVEVNGMMGVKVTNNLNTLNLLDKKAPKG